MIDLQNSASSPGGILRIQSFAARLSAPMPDVMVTVTAGAFTQQIMTDSEGNTSDIFIETPARSFSLEEDNTTTLPYATCSLVATKEGYRPVEIEDIQMFDGQVTLARLEFVTSAGERTLIPDEPVRIPVHGLFSGLSGSGPAPVTECPSPRVLGEVVIPTNVIVHLGKPSESARDVTVSFREYIANVASSEIYPTWPEQAIRANIHAQISITLNRIYTEWYRSKGYSFTITSSPSYDQYYVHGRTIFDVMERITDDIFNTFVRKTGTVNPFYTGYCDGKLVSCDGLKQWGTVTLADQGKNALQILKNYFGNDIEVARSNNIQSIPQSYPGSPLREGDTGTAVYTIQRQLNRIAKDYPSFGTLSVDGVFGASVKASVQKFQRQFSLTADGIVGRQTWYKISYIYVSVTDLAELTSEGETSTGGDLSTGNWNGTVLRVGSRGTSVEQIQYWLEFLSRFYDDLLTPAVDGVFGSGTEAAVKAFQRKFKLTVDGVVGQITWNAIFAEYDKIESDIGIPNEYPGTPLREGDRGNDVKQLQFWLRIAKTNYAALDNVAVDGVFGAGTRGAVVKFQTTFQLNADGIVGRVTWEKLYEVYLDIVNGLLAPNLRPGEFAGTLRVGSSGAAVRELQYYLFLMAAYENSIPSVTIDGNFGSGTERSVKAFQTFADLTADGIVGPATWNALYQLASRLRVSGPVITITQRDYPGKSLSIGDSGSAVLFYSILLARIAYFFDSVLSFGETSFFDHDLFRATKSFQALIAAPETGIVDANTWAAAEELSLTLLANDIRREILATTDNYPGFATAEGSAGPHVKIIQNWINRYGASFCGTDFLDENGHFAADEKWRVSAIQETVDFSPNGIVDRDTWNVLRVPPMEGAF